MSATDVGDTRHRIRAVALELFATEGFQRTSLRQIAARLDITKAALYYHFPSKADLLRSILLPAKADIDRFLDDVEARGDLTTREILEGYYDVLVAHRPVWLTLITDASGLTHVDLAAWVHEWFERFIGVLVGHDASPGQKVHAVVAIGGLARAIVVPYTAIDLTADEVRDAVVTAACAALTSADVPDAVRP